MFKIFVSLLSGHASHNERVEEVRLRKQGTLLLGGNVLSTVTVSETVLILSVIR